MDGEGWLPPSISWISSIDLPLVSGTINNTKNMPSTLHIVNNQNVLYIWMTCINDVNNLVTKKTKSQLNVHTIEQATPNEKKLIQLITFQIITIKVVFVWNVCIQFLKRKKKWILSFYSYNNYTAWYGKEFSQFTIPCNTLLLY